jgi:antitoxin component of RelBE/YafQ-DinJ toxin-antitoxin module
MPKNATINFRLDADVRAKAEKLAKREGLTLSKWAARAIEHATKK